MYLHTIWHRIGRQNTHFLKCTDTVSDDALPFDVFQIETIWYKTAVGCSTADDSVRSMLQVNVLHVRTLT